MGRNLRGRIFLVMVCTTLSAGGIASASDSRGFTDRPVGVSGSDSLQHMAVLGTDKNIWTRDWIVDSLGARWTAWTLQPDLVVPAGDFASSPWLQAPNGGGIVNLFVLGGAGNALRAAQWTESQGIYSQTRGIEGFDSVVASISATQTARGWQTIFAVFSDSSLRYRQWDSVQWTWSGWTVLGTGFALLPPFATQVLDTQVNVYALRPDGTVAQDWWKGSSWSGWVYPPWQKVFSSPSSVNFDQTTHFLFAQDSDCVAVGAIWDGISWTVLPPSGVKTLSGVTPVVAGADSLLIYALSPDSELIRFPWTRRNSWGSVEDLGPVPPSTTGLARKHTPRRPELRQEGAFLVLPPELGLAPGRLRIVDSRGQVAQTARWTAGTSRIPLDLRPGIYWVQSSGQVFALPVPR
jgi:hypothetical protein